MKAIPHKATEPQKNVDARDWWIVDLKDVALGRAASQIAKVLRGKNKPLFAPHQDVGDFVVCINAEKVKLTGRKMDDKVYRFFSGYVGGLREVAAKDVLAKKPEHLIKTAVAGMLPKNPMGKRLMTKLKVYTGDKHPHAAQAPRKLEV